MRSGRRRSKRRRERGRRGNGDRGRREGEGEGEGGGGEGERGGPRSREDAVKLRNEFRISNIQILTKDKISFPEIFLERLKLSKSPQK